MKEGLKQSPKKNKREKDILGLGVAEGIDGSRQVKERKRTGFANITHNRITTRLKALSVKFQKQILEFN